MNTTKTQHLKVIYLIELEKRKTLKMESEYSGDIEPFVHQVSDSFANERVFTIKTSRRSHASQRRAENKNEES